MIGRGCEGERGLEMLVRAEVGKVCVCRGGGSRPGHLVNA